MLLGTTGDCMIEGPALGNRLGEKMVWTRVGSSHTWPTMITALYTVKRAASEQTAGVLTYILDSGRSTQDCNSKSFCHRTID